jgi:hypothetical protein
MIVTLKEIDQILILVQQIQIDIDYQVILVTQPTH